MRGWIGSSIGSVALVCALGAQAINVGSGGQASYGVPLSVPPGVAGMAPNLALSYADGGINGPVGVGWSVQGISAVTRCPSSKLVDGEIVNSVKALTGNNRPTVRFDGYDRLCLDGQRLIATNASGVPLGATSNDALGLSGNDYREFRTEKDSFARIRAYGMAVAGTPDAGPALIRVWTKSGQVYEYGTSPSGSVVSKALINAQGTNKVAVWAVSRLSDSLGNYLDFKYDVRELAWGSGKELVGEIGQEWNIAEIQYTGNVARGLTPQNKVVFEYDDRSTTDMPADASEAYQGSSKNISVRRLKAVRTYINSPNPDALGASANAILVRAWSLNYGISPRSGRSRLSSVKECTDTGLSKCLPATTFSYSDGAAPSFASHNPFLSSSLASKKLMQFEGYMGTLTGDFNGDGKTDIIRWSNNPAENEMHFSLGNGAFEHKTNFNLNGSQQRLFEYGSCYSSTVMDLNGDGRSDILRVAKPSCGESSKVFLSLGDGSFSTVAVPAQIDLTQLTQSVVATDAPCEIEFDSPAPAPAPTTSGRPSAGPVQLARVERELVAQGLISRPANMCYRVTYGDGKRFHIMDMSGDGLPDIVTTYFPGYQWNTSWGPEPDNSRRCTHPSEFVRVGWPSHLQVCTRVFLSQGDGSFVEDRAGTHPNQYTSLYRDPPPVVPSANPYWNRPSEADLDGDGLLDLADFYWGYWRNRGDGTFEAGDALLAATNCSLSIDFNGDQRGDCLRPESPPANQSLTVVAGSKTANVKRFNLTTAVDGLYAKDSDNRQILGVLVEDLDADGRQDILRWSTTSSNNGVYLSNGDGSFRARLPAGLTGLSIPLSSTDGRNSFVSGDFLGNGTLQLLQVREDVNATNKNVLLALQGDRTPIDHLIGATTGSGVVFSIAPREPLTLSANYSTDRGTANAAYLPLLDLQPPSYVITSSTKTSPGFGAVQTLYSYHGLKAERNGRGMLGFRETRQQTKAPNGADLTVATRNLLAHPYIGVAGVTETYLGTLSLANAQRLSRTTYSYCDKSSAASPTEIGSGGTSPVPCATSAPVQRPYLYQSLEEGWDLNNSALALPTVRTTNSYNDWGDPLTIEVTTAGTALGLSQSFAKTVTNTYETPDTADNRWILGRLKTAQVLQTAPNSLSSLSASKGTAPRADQIDGITPFVLGKISAPTILPQALNETIQLVAELRNTSNISQPITQIAVVNSVGAGFTLGTQACPATLQPSASCNLSFNFRPTAVQTYQGTVQARVGGQLITASIQGEGSPLAINPVNIGSVAIDSNLSGDVVVRNVGATSLPVEAVTAASVNGVGFTFVSTTCSSSIAPQDNCSIKVKFSPTTAGLREGQVRVRTVAGIEGNGKVSATGVNVGVVGVNFGFVKVNESKSEIISLANGSNANVTVSGSIAISGSFISIENNACIVGKVLAPTQSCQITLKFAPTAIGDQSGSFSVPTNVGTVGANWYGVAPAWGFNGIDFGRVATNEDLMPASTTIYNNGSTPVVFDNPFAMGVAVVNNGSAQFYYNGSTCSGQLNPGNTCTVSLYFKPTAATTQTAQLRVRGNGSLMSANVTGVGVAVSLGNISYGFRGPNITNLSWAAGISNLSSSAVNLNLSSAAISGSSAFSLVAPGGYTPCTATLAAGSTCYFGVRFSPTSSGVDETADLTVISSVGNLRSSLTGSTRAWATSVNFPNTPVGGTSGDSAMTIENRSGAALTLPSNFAALMPTNFEYRSTTCNATLNNSSSCTVSIRFKPTSVGRRDAAVNIPTNIGNIPMMVGGAGI
jgi:hypothetical protein